MTKTSATHVLAGAASALVCMCLSSVAWADCPPGILPTGGDYNGADLFINDDCTLTGEHTNIGTLVVDAQAILQASPGALLRIQARNIEIQGAISADQAGHDGGAGGGRGQGGQGGAGPRAGANGVNTTECGRPGIDFNAGGGGGGAAAYQGSGGQGGHGGDANDGGCQGTPGGAGGSEINNTGNFRLGAGAGGGGGPGGARFNPGQPGERGGGYLIIDARTLRVEGRISANGGRGGAGGTSPDSFHGGGGGGGAAGGAIQIYATYLVGSGVIEARGGQGGPGGQGDIRDGVSYAGSGGGGGGGGLVVINYANNAAFTGSCSAEGGASGAGTNGDSGPGAPGTVGECLQNLVNGVPTANAGGPYITTENGSVTVNGSQSVDPDGDELTYEWDCNNDGTYDVQGVSAQCSYVGDGRYTIRLRVTDPENGQDTTTGEVIVTEAPPTASVTGDETGTEGLTLNFDSSGSDGGPDAIAGYEWDFNYDGSFDPADGVTGASVQNTFCDNGVYNVAVRVTDDGGSSAIAQHRVVVQNAEPTVTSTAPTQAVEGQTYTYTLTVEDPGCDEFTYNFIRRPEGMEIDDNGAITFSPTFRDAEAGCIDVRVLVSDDDFGRVTHEWELCVEFADSDSDTLPDTWETLYNLDPNNPDDATEDNDGDGRNNLAEFANDTSPREFDGPSAPRLSAPTNDAEVDINAPTLRSFRAQHPLGDDMVYTVEVYSFVESADDITPDLLLISESDLTPGENSPTLDWTIPEETDLQDETSYCWRVRATDSVVNGPWSDLWCFNVNLVNDPPTAPAPVSPSNNTEVDTPTPTLTVNNCSDPDNDDVTYTFVLYRGGTATPVASLSGVPGGEQGMTSWTLPEEDTLEENENYCWTAQCRDNQGLLGDTSDLFCFTVNSSNELPSTPVIIAPLPEADQNRAVLTDPSVTVTIRNSTDPEGDPIAYTFEVSEDINFASVLLSEEIVDQGGTETSWTPAVEWTDNTAYFARVIASDGAGNSAPAVVEFFMNFQNDPPPPPEVATPVRNTIIFTATPNLTVRNAVDPDGDKLRYRFEIYHDAELTEEIDNGTVDETPQLTQYRVKAPLGIGSYFWRARSNDGNNDSEWSEVGSFLVQDPNGGGGGTSNPSTGSTSGTSDGGGDGGDGGSGGSDDEGCGCVQVRATQPAAPQGAAFLGLFGLLGFAWLRRRQR